MLTVPALALVAAACATPDIDAPQSHEVRTVDRFALIVLGYSEDDRHPSVTDQLISQAYFVEHTHDDVLEVPSRGDIVNLLSLPAGTMTPEIDAIDGCTVEARDLLSQVGVSDVRLLDAGELLVDSPHRVIRLDSNYFPDVFSSVRGLSYDGVAQNTGVFAGDWLTVEADGSDEVGAFSVTVGPPPILRLQSVGGSTPHHARVWLDTDRRQGAGLHLTWQSDATDEAAAVTVSYVRRGFDRMATVTCVAADDGEFTIPEAALAQLPGFGPDQTDRLVVARQSVVSFTAEGIDDGTVVAASRDEVLLL